MGESVVLDASWTTADHRATARKVAAAAGAAIVELRCELDPEVARQRITARMRAVSASDATPEVADHLRELAEPWPESQAIDTSRNFDDVALAALTAYERARSRYR